MRTRLSGGFGFPLGCVLGVVVTILSAAFGATGHPGISVFAMVLVIDAVAVLSTARATLGTIAVCWCLHAGFILGRRGELALTAQSGRDALILVLCGLAAIILVDTLRAAEKQAHNVAFPHIPTQRSGASQSIPRLGSGH